MKIFKFFYYCICIFWILDVCNFSFMAIFDTAVPCNDLFWVLFFGLFAAIEADINIEPLKKESEEK